MEEKLREYAHLIVSVGLNLQKGQTLILSSPVECAPFARLCVSAASGLEIRPELDGRLYHPRALPACAGRRL